MTQEVTPFEHTSLPGRVLFGAGSVDRVAAEVADLGVNRAMVVMTRSTKVAGDRIMDGLGHRGVLTFGEVRQHVPEELAAAARVAAEDAGVDGIVAVGGGSAIGLAKAVGVVSGAPIVAVPTTYSGSEMTPIYGISGAHKRTATDLRALPHVVVYDPHLTVGLPPDVTATSGFNALAHGVEALYAPGISPLVALQAEEAIRSLCGALPAAVASPGDLVARGWALYGSYLAGAALAVAGTALHHTLCHVLAGTFGLDHAATHAVMLPYVAAFNAAAAPEAMTCVAVSLGGRPDPALAAPLLHELAVQIGAPTSLAALGMPGGGIDEAADRAAAETGDSNPRPVDVAGLRRLLFAAQDGRAPT
jgi:maleylacetate reductase